MRLIRPIGELLDDVVTGIRGALFIAAVFSLFAIGKWLVPGSVVTQALGISLPILVATYFIGGAISGAVVGCLLPLEGSLPGRLFLGFVAALPTVYCVQLIVVGPHIELLSTVLIAAFLGPSLAYATWTVDREYR